MKRAVVSFADEAGNYQSNLRQLGQSLHDVKYSDAFLPFVSYSDIGSPSHQIVPYAFKAYSLSKAFQMGYESILWVDSPIVATQKLDFLFNHIDSQGYVFFDNIGFTVGDYTSDQCLEHFGISRETAFKIPMIMACCMGFSTHCERAMEFFAAYSNAANDGVSYQGTWTNVNGEVSSDQKVKGHRHDQSVASILIYLLGMDIVKGNETFFMYDEHLKVMPKAQTVCLISL